MATPGANAPPRDRVISDDLHSESEALAGDQSQRPVVLLPTGPHAFAMVTKVNAVGNLASRRSISASK
jgi:hypothetical protein